MVILRFLDTSVTITFQQKLSKLVNYTRSQNDFCAKKMVLRKQRFYV